MPDPAEMPGPDDPGSGGGGGGIGQIRIPREIPQELPAYLTRSLASEIIQIRNRLNAFENASIMARFGGGAAPASSVDRTNCPIPTIRVVAASVAAHSQARSRARSPRSFPPSRRSRPSSKVASRRSAPRSSAELEQIRAEIKQQRG